MGTTCVGMRTDVRAYIAESLSSPLTRLMSATCTCPGEIGLIVGARAWRCFWMQR